MNYIIYNKTLRKFLRDIGRPNPDKGPIVNWTDNKTRVGERFEDLEIYDSKETAIDAAYTAFRIIDPERASVRVLSFGRRWQKETEMNVVAEVYKIENNDQGMQHERKSSMPIVNIKGYYGIS